MSVHLKRAIEGLKSNILRLGGLVEADVRQAMQAVEERDVRLAEQVIDNDVAIDEFEVEIEEECLKMLALYQPVATDLRFIIAVLKINNDLERIGDASVNIAERALALVHHGRGVLQFDFMNMAQKVQAMLKMSLDALVNLSPAQAREVCACDDEIDRLNRQVYEAVQDAVADSPQDIEVLLLWLSVSNHLERIADHATNIAEDLLYMIEGEIVRHKGKVV